LKENIVQTKSFDFALRIIGLYKRLKAEKEFVLSKQILRSGTSVGANIEEGISAQSAKDFLSKMNISLKEARETRYWLKLLDKSKIVDIDYTDYLKDNEELVSLLTAIVKTTRERISNNSITKNT
jgi:four helix bundle protein